MNKTINLQDVYLNQIRKSHIQVTVFLLNGYKLKGLLKGFDNFVILIEGEGKQEMVFKHAISTILPARPIENILNDKEV